MAFRSTCCLKPFFGAGQCSRKNIVFEIREPFQWHLLFASWATWHKLCKPIWASLSSSTKWECAVKNQVSKSAQHSVKHMRCLTDARYFPYSLKVILQSSYDHLKVELGQNLDPLRLQLMLFPCRPFPPRGMVSVLCVFIPLCPFGRRWWHEEMDSLFRVRGMKFPTIEHHKIFNRIFFKCTLLWRMIPRSQ